MSKTPKELAKEYCNQFSWNDPREEDAHDAFLAGYQAAMNSPEKPDTCEHILDMEKMVDVDKVKFCVYCNDTHKGNCAIGKGKNHPAFNFSEIVVKIESSWVSVKDRLPEINQQFIAFVENKEVCNCCRYQNRSSDNSPSFYASTKTGLLICGLESISHWMPLPAAPKEEV